jgi:DNA-binding GntR family transcriptional regulator
VTLSAPSNFKLPALPDLISAALREEIATGALEPGATIQMRPLAERFGVSSMPVREALRRLEAEGLVLFDKNRSITVTRLSAAELDELSIIRLELEPLALRLAIPNLIDDADAMAELERLVDEMDDVEIDPDRWRTLNEQFHRTLYGAARMPRLQDVIVTMMRHVERYLRLHVRTPQHITDAQAQHREILECCRRGDTELAEAVLRSHIRYARDRLSPFLSGDGATADADREDRAQTRDEDAA